MFKKLLLSLLVLGMMPAHAFLSYIVLEKNGKKIFIAGLEQSNQSFKQLAQLHAHKFVNFIEFYNKKSTAPVRCFFEATNSETLRENLLDHPSARLQFDVIVAAILKHKRTLADQQTRAPFQLLNYDPRIEKPSDDIISFFPAAENLIENFKHLETLKTKLRTIKKSVRKQKGFATIKQYKDMLGLWSEQIKKWEKQLWDARLSKELIFMRKQKEAFRQATTQALEALNSCHEDTKLPIALISLLEQTKTKEEAKSKVKELSNLLIRDIDYRFAQLGFFTKTLLEQQQNSTTLFLMGHGHVKTLGQMLNQCGYSIQAERHPEELGNDCIMITPDFTQDFFKNLSNLFLSDENKISDAELRSARIKSEVPMCATCSNAGSKLKRCNGCKNICYCSVACQKKDWKTHKTECAKPGQ